MEDNNNQVEEAQVNETTQETVQETTPNVDNSTVDNTETINVDSNEPKNTSDAPTQVNDDANKTEDQTTNVTHEEATISPAVEEKENAIEEVGFGGKLVSFLFPIIGVILYFVNKNDRKNPKDYLTWALIGFIIGVVCNMMLTAASM